MVDQARLLDLGDYVRLIRARRTLVIVVALVFAVGSIAYVVHRGAKYTASSRVLVEPLVNTVTGGDASNADAPNMQTESEILKSVDTANVVRSTLGVSTSAVQLVKGVRVSVPPDTNVMVVGYQSSSAITAARLANAFARAYVSQRRDSARNQVLGVVAALRAIVQSDRLEISRLQGELRTTHGSIARKSLKGQIVGLNQDIEATLSKIVDLNTTAASIEGGHLVQPASIPPSASGPALWLVLLAGLIIGLIVGAIVAVARGLLSDQISDQDELSSRLGAPVIGRIPTVHVRQPRTEDELVTRIDPASPASEAYRTLATNIRFIGSDGSLGFLVVTSALMGEGKSTTAANLAVVLAESGVRTLLVDADLRRPRAGRFLGINEGPGLREALEGWADVPDLVLSTSVPRLAFLGSGEPPDDPVSLLAWGAADGVFSQIASSADLVICDAPAVLPVADASLLTKRADAVLFVHDPAIAPRGSLRDAVSQLRTVGTPILGGVYNNIPTTEGPYRERYSLQVARTSRISKAWRVPSGLIDPRHRHPQAPGTSHGA
jgi:capsular exopolysaccharide synthesis family protein